MNITLDNRVLYIKTVNPTYFMDHKATEEELLEGVIVPFLTPKTYFTSVGNCDSLPLTTKFKRSGIIPYTTINNCKYFCLGINSKYGNLTDFGRNVMEYETFATCAANSLNELSFGIFDFSPTTVYRYSTLIYDHNMIIFLTAIKVENLKDIVTLFYQKYLKSNSNKLCAITWVPEDIFFKLMKTGVNFNQDGFIYPAVYRPICNLFKNAIGQNFMV